MRARVAPALAILALLLADCSPASAPEPARPDAGAARSGGRFVYPLPVEPTTLNFVTGGDLTTSLITRLIGDSLVDHDLSMGIVPRLASSWDWSAGGRVLTFHLRAGVRFHDGVTLTSADVVYTYERVIDPRSRALSFLDAMLPVERVEAPDPLTVRVTYRRPFAPALAGWEVPILPRHLYEREDFLRSRWNRAPIGSGPFRFASWEAGQRIVLSANLDYWGGRACLDSLDFEVIPSQETALRALLAGEVDYARLTPVQWSAQADNLAFARRFRTIRFVPLFVFYIVWRGDGSNPFFADPVVRRALSLALDREGYVRTILRGLGEVADSPFRRGTPQADPALPPIPHDPDQAAALLDGAGWRLEPASGVRRRAGVPLRFTLLIFGGNEDQVQFSQVAQENLRRLGVEMSIARLDWPAVWARLQKGDFQAALTGMTLTPDPDGVYGLLHSSQVVGGQNYAAFRDRLIDGWLEEGRTILDPRGRLAAYHEIDRRLREQQPYTFLFFPEVRAALSRRFENAEPSPLGLLDPYPGASRLCSVEGSPR